MKNIYYLLFKILVSIIIIFITFTIVFYFHYNYIKYNWSKYRCNPIYSFYAPDIEENIDYCIKNNKTNYINYLLIPFIKLLGLITFLVNNIFDKLKLENYQLIKTFLNLEIINNSINKFKKFLSNILNSIEKLINNIERKNLIKQN